MFLVDIPETLDGGCQHGGNGQEEGELGCRFPRQTLAHTSDDRGPAATESRQQYGQHLETTDAEGSPIRYLPFVINGRIFEPVVDEQKNDAAADHDDRNKI